MKKLLTALAVVALVATASKSMAQNWGLWDGDRSYIGINQNGTTNFWNVWNAGTGPFDGQALGTYSNGQTLNINAYDIKTWKNEGAGGNVTGGSFNWAVYATGSRPTNISFSSIAINWIEDLGSGNQKWGFSGGTTSILSAPAVSFSGSNNYTFEFYVQMNGGTDPTAAYDNNGGAADNYTATFTTVPEPSTYELLALSAAGFGGYIIRRRRR